MRDREQGANRRVKSLDQVRALYAWRCVREAKGKLGNEFSEYETLAKKMPAMISTSGLGQTLAFLAQKAKMNGNGTVSPRGAKSKPHAFVFVHLQNWLRGNAVGSEEEKRALEEAMEAVYAPPYAGSKKASVLEDLMEGDSRTYLRATAETVAVLNYLRLFATGFATENG